MSEDLYLLTFQTGSNVLEVFIKYPETYELSTHYSLEILSNNSIISCQYIRYVFNEWRISRVLRLQLYISAVIWSECIIFPAIYTSLLRMDTSPCILVSGQIKCLVFVWSQVQECVLGIFDTRLSHCTQPHYSVEMSTIIGFQPQVSVDTHNFPTFIFPHELQL